MAASQLVRLFALYVSYNVGYLVCPSVCNHFKLVKERRRRKQVRGIKEDLKKQTIYIIVKLIFAKLSLNWLA